MSMLTVKDPNTVLTPEYISNKYLQSNFCSFIEQNIIGADVAAHIVLVTWEIEKNVGLWYSHCLFLFMLSVTYTSAENDALLKLNLKKKHCGFV